ncbi:MAG: SDR family oxidoreductase [Bryobacteraceae bacterium]|jgi:NAD(P)-dependent dehydrogenase (short-subunit alcohol dehydrogenase family)
MKTMVITGGGSGIGRAVALECAVRGDRVGVLDLDGRSARQTAVDALAAGADAALGLECDVSREEHVAQAFDETVRQLGPLYGAFANAGMDAGGFLHELPLELWQRVIGTNLTGVYLTCKHALRHLLAGGKPGSIVCTSSPAATVAFAAGAAGAYSASKGGISALVRCMAVDYARYGIRVNAVVPGATETKLMWANVEPADMPAMRQRICEEVPLGRLASPEEPARAVVWLLSEESSYVTGSHLVCDGGILAKASISV